ncbi:MAG: hypothetical protein AAF417_18460 [Pseudomonadota bacterium]
MNRDEVSASMPALLRHEGVWRGRYRTVNLDGAVVDEHDSEVECIFPTDGPYHYVQRNRFEWSDGRVHKVEFGGVLRGARVYWDTEAFRGYGWATVDDVVLLTLERKDVANASFTEIIVLGADGANRARTWHWFKDGRLYQRTLCDEYRS